MYNKQRHKINDKAEISIPNLFKRGFIFVLIFLFIGLLNSVLFSLLFYKSANPTDNLNLAGYLALYCSVTVTSILFVKGLHSRQSLGSAILGAMIFLLTYLLSIIMGQNENGVQELILRLCIILICILISVLPKFFKRKSKKIKRH